MSIKVENLTKIFGEQKAVNNISFEISSGTIIGFLGPNGAGKSTTMKMLTTYIPPTSGTAKVCGFDIIKQPMEVKRITGYLPESNPLYYDLYVREYLEFVAGIHDLGKVKKERVEEMIEITGLKKEVNKKIGTLSKGYKQRVGLAQAMIHHPKVLILDEPTSGLDPNQIMDIRELIVNIGKERTVLLSTHIMQEVEAMCNRLIIINSGNIVADDKIENIQKSLQTKESYIVVSFEKNLTLADISRIPYVMHVDEISNNTFKIFTDKDTALLRKEVMQWSVQNDIGILSLQLGNNSLEDTFRALTKGK